MTKQQQKIIEYLSVEGAWAHNTYRDTYGNPWNFDALIVYSEGSCIPRIVTHVWLDRIGKLSVRLSKKMQYEIERPAESYKAGEEEIGLSDGTYNYPSDFIKDFHFDCTPNLFNQKYNIPDRLFAASVCVSDDIRGLSSHAMVFKMSQHISLQPKVWYKCTTFKILREATKLQWNGKLWQFPDGKEIQTHEWIAV